MLKVCYNLKKEEIIMSNTPTTIRLDDELKEAVTPILNTVGMSLNTYINLALRQLVLQKKVPFEILTGPVSKINVTGELPRDGQDLPKGIGDALLKMGR